jgi:hypothetical protein
VPLSPWLVPSLDRIPSLRATLDGRGLVVA